MDKDLFLYILFFIPVFWAAVIDQERLKVNKVFLKHLFISVVLIAYGSFPEVYKNSNPKSLSYFGAQMLFWFLLLYVILRKVYINLYHKEPQFTEFTTTFADKIFSGLIYFGMISLPFLVDYYIIQNL
jgi:hypothetical protein